MLLAHRFRGISPSYNGRVETVDVIVAGAGIIGLTIALELAQSGYSVRVLERGQAMSEASWAAAGMLSAEDPEHPAELNELAALSIRLYPEFLSMVERLSGHSVRLRTQGTLMTTHGKFHHNDTPTCYSISADEAERRVPGLAAAGRHFLWLEEASLDPRDLCVALPLAVAAAGAALQQETEVLAVTSHSGSVEVRTRRGTVTAGAFVNCCGAWAAEVQPLAAEVEPRKGQMLTVRLPPPLDLAYVLRAPDVYMVPRGAGQIVIGATVERVGFDRRVEPMVVEMLHSQAVELWPPIASARVVESWSGLRPGTPDGLPLIGSAGQPHCWVATGHFRNGILLAPATALIVRQLLQGRPPAVRLDAFSPGRVSDKVRSAAL
jgi:glycine oxidase